MRQTMTILGPAAFAAVSIIALASAAAAQPLTFRVGPSSAPSQVGNLGYTSEGWMKIKAGDLRYFGPRYDRRSGTRIGRGSPIPDWIETAEMQSISIPGLTSGAYYNYFISPDQRIVVLDQSSRRVMRVLR